MFYDYITQMTTLDIKLSHSFDSLKTGLYVAQFCM